MDGKESLFEFKTMKWCKKTTKQQQQQDVVNFIQLKAIANLIIRNFFVFGGHYQYVAMHVCIPTYFTWLEWRRKAGILSINTDAMFKPKT